MKEIVIEIRAKDPTLTQLSVLKRLRTIFGIKAAEPLTRGEASDGIGSLKFIEHIVQAFDAATATELKIIAQHIRKNMPPWYVYIIQCADDTFYTGITTNIERRLKEHNSKKAGAKYTRARRPVKLVYQEEAPTRSHAAKREWKIKQLTRQDKERMINGKRKHGKS